MSKNIVVLENTGKWNNRILIKGRIPRTCLSGTGSSIAKENATTKTSVKMGICPRCKKPLNLSHPDAVDFKGERFHSDCAKKAGAPANSVKARDGVQYER
jgi:hypothetical protein